MSLVNDFLDWLSVLPADFAFLLALPFLVAVAGLLADRPLRRDPAPKPAGPKPATVPPRDAINPG